VFGKRGKDPDVRTHSATPCSILTGMPSSLASGMDVWIQR
jgi:hypothetical protein